MATNFVQDGDVVTLVAPYAVASGAGALVNTHVFGVALETLASGASGEFAVEGVWDIACLSTDVIAQGAQVYWDNTNKRCTATATSNTLIGVATTAKGSGATTVRVRLNGIGV